MKWTIVAQRDKNRPTFKIAFTKNSIDSPIQLW